MRKNFILLSVVMLIIVLFGSAFMPKSKASASRANREGNMIQGMQPGSRCTRLQYDPAEKKNKRLPLSAAAPRTRCPRLSYGPRDKGRILPNTPPKIGLSASTAYLSPNVGAEVKLKAIACDLEDENVLYTYTVTGGRIAGGGFEPEAIWNLSGVSPGEYTVTVEVDDGCGCVSSTGAQVTVQQQ